MVNMYLKYILIIVTIMAFANMIIKKFIEKIIQFESVYGILDECKNQSEKGFIFERLYDIVIKFGFCEKFKNSDFIHLIGNSNNARLKILENFDTYLNGKVYSGNSSGCSDITLQNKKDDIYIFVSSKFPKSNEDVKKQKSVKYYDVQDILAMTIKNKHIYKEFEIYLVVPNKKKVLEKIKNANESSEYITEYMTEDNILDLDDINKYFLAFKRDIIKNKNKDWSEIYLAQRENLNLRFHQELITQKTSDLIEEGNKSFLWGCKCRSGKTYMIGGLIMKQFEIKQKLNVLIITPAPTETTPQFTDGLFRKFREFNDFVIHDIQGSEMLNNIELGENNIFIMSKQLLQKYTDDNVIESIKNLKLDIIGFDENHFSGTTELSKNILSSYSSKNTIKVYLTATYNKSLKEWEILPECQMYWDIEDEQICKSILGDETNLCKLKEKHGKYYVMKTIKHFTNLGKSIEDIFKPYERMPDLYLITNMFDSQRYEIIKEKLKSENKMGFCFDTLYALNTNKTQFLFKKEVKIILRYISGSNKEVDGEKTIFPRIENLSSERETRTTFTQIWFLPSDNINEISQCLSQLMLEDDILKQYDILCINRKNKKLAKDVSAEISKAEKIAKGKKKLGLILLAGNMLTLGITLNLCDVVILMNNTLSSDKVMQQMYRCMTEADNKKIGFVVDLNISRVINTCINYTIYKNEQSISDKISYIIKNHLINIDVDMMENKQINADIIVNKLMNIWKEDPVNSFKMLLRRLDNDFVTFDNPTQKLINKMFTKSIKNGKINAEIMLNDELQELPKGQERNKQYEGSSNSDNEKTEKEEQISFTKDVLNDVIPLSCILTIKDKNMDFMEMLNNIKDNPSLLETFDDQCLLWWNRKGLMDLIKDIINKFFDKTSDTYNVAIQFKLSLQSLIDNPKELLELINDCLKPKESEKKKFGEVFTPMTIVNEMLDTLPKNVWCNKNLRWLDPANGMGNFPIAIYLRLMEGLQKEIPDGKARKKHILEKMIYMIELNKKNCFIAKQIFDINNDYKLKIYNKDALKINIKEGYTFDVIVGNPPYNQELTKTGALPLYNKFIEKYIDGCIYLLFIVPSRWFAGGKGLDKFRKFMLERNDIKFIKHFDNASKIFGNSVEIKGGVNYFLKDSKYNGLCNYNGKLIDFAKYDILVESKYYNLIDKVIQYDSLNKIYKGRCFGIESNDKRLTDNKKLLKCFVSQQKGFIKYVDEKYIKKEYDFWKVITARAAYEQGSGFGNTFIGNTNEIHTGSYISFKVKNKQEAESLISYMKCKFTNLLLAVRKISQDISENTIKWIPLPSLNKIWTDEQLFEYYELDEYDIELIKNTTIKGFKNAEI